MKNTSKDNNLPQCLAGKEDFCKEEVYELIADYFELFSVSAVITKNTELALSYQGAVYDYIKEGEDSSDEPELRGFIENTLYLNMFLANLYDRFSHMRHFRELRGVER